MLDLLIELSTRNLGAVFVLLTVLQFAACEIGYALGRYRVARKDQKDEGVNVTVGSILALLAFVLALNLSVATSRFSERRAASLNEANAISTAWLQAKAIGGPQASAIASLLETYATQRITFVQASRNAPEIAESSAQTNAAQTEIWGRMTALLAENHLPETTSLMNALTQTFDATAAMRLAMAYAMPIPLVLLLFGLTILGIGLLGYQFGLLGKRHKVLTLMVSVLWTAVIVEILDVGTARLGAVRTQVTPYEWTLAGFGTVPGN